MPFATKIFISATMEEIEKPIKNSIENLDKDDKPTIIPYCTGIDYSYVNPIYFKNDLNIIINSIKNDKTDNKWLIFVTNKDSGNKIYESLGDEISTTIYSGTKNEELESIIINSKFIYTYQI